MVTRRDQLAKTVVSLLLGAASALALFLVMHLFVDEPPQFIDPIVEVFELPDPPDERRVPIERHRPPASPQQPQRLVRTPFELGQAQGDIAAFGSHVPAGGVQLPMNRVVDGQGVARRAAQRFEVRTGL